MPNLVAQNVITENLLGHRGEERDGVGHGEAHLFCISHLASQTAVAHSTLVVKFLHYFLKEFLWLSSREREGDLGTARNFSNNNLHYKACLQSPSKRIILIYVNSPLWPEFARTWYHTTLDKQFCWKLHVDG